MPKCLLNLFAALLFLSTPCVVRGEPGPQTAEETRARARARASSSLVVWTETPGFDELAEQITSEIETLLEPEKEPWQVEKIPRPAGTHLVDRLSEVAREASMAVIVGPDPKSMKSLGEQSLGIPVVWVDPMGWIEPQEEFPQSLGILVTEGSLEARIEGDLAAFRTLLEQVVDLPNSWEILVPLEAQQPELAQKLEQVAAKVGGKLRILEVTSSSGSWGSILQESSNKMRGFYLPPGSAVDAEPLAIALRESRIPSFSGRSRNDVTAGLLGAQAVRRGLVLARWTALEVLGRVRNAPRVPMRSLEFGPAEGERLVLNLGTALDLGFQIPARLRLAAEVLGEVPRGVPTGLSEVRLEALEANLDLEARSLLTAAGEEEVQQALSVLRPRLALSGLARGIDAESAEAAFGASPEYLVTAAGQASWILFSEEARSTLDITRRLQAVRELELRELELDLELQAMVLLLEVARARAAEAIEREQLDLTFADLDTARARRALGATGRGDIARLEAREAGARRALAAARGQRRSLEVSLNRLLSRPLDGEILPRVASEEGQILPFEEAVSRPQSLAALNREFSSRARTRAPEIAAAMEVVEARQRAVLAAGRAFYLPEAILSGQIEIRLNEGGAGTEPPQLPDVGSFPRPPDTRWTLGLGMELPLATGGARKARQAQAGLELDAARVLLAAAEQRVDERVQRAMVGLEASYEEAHQAGVAVRAARRAFDVVNAGYSRGSESLTTLLDAQTELRVASRQQAAARYGALARWYELQRAVGEFLEPEEEEELAVQIDERGARETMLSSASPPPGASASLPENTP